VTVFCDRTRSDGFNLRDGGFRLDIRQKIFTMRLVKHWNRGRKHYCEVVEAPSLETVKVRLDRALNRLM